MKNRLIKNRLFSCRCVNNCKAYKGASSGDIVTHAINICFPLSELDRSEGELGYLDYS